MLLDGLFIPLTTPFYADGASYLRKLEHNVARYSRTPAAGLVALSPWSEAVGLSDEETRESLRVIGESAAAEKVLLACATEGSVRGAVSLAERAAEAQFDAVLLAAPMEWRRMLRGGALAEVELFFRSVADRSPLPVVLWRETAELGLAMPVERVMDLAGHPNVIGMFDAGLTAPVLQEIVAGTQDVRREVTVTPVFAAVTRRMREAAADGPATFVDAGALTQAGASTAVVAPKPALKTRSKSVGFQVVAAGPASGMLPLLEAGVSGMMPELAACAPQGCHEVLAAFRDGNPELAELKAARLGAADAAVRELGVAAVKYGCDLNGYYGGAARLPRVPLSAEERVRVDAAFREVRN
ncbi:MAG TPA: dihydrodipicolinate synthase family protein [Acidobacteriaceae bacterium]|jgi:dihydrodipicolinate synthase/N-acetylneuraminate lyase|nr:dihydrodipicolinate synthase family protein [Acidobacteriaceae bacterium]